MSAWLDQNKLIIGIAAAAVIVICLTLGALLLYHGGKTAGTATQATAQIRLNHKVEKDYAKVDKALPHGGRAVKLGWLRAHAGAGQ